MLEGYSISNVAIVAQAGIQSLVYSLTLKGLPAS